MLQINWAVPVVGITVVQRCATSCCSKKFLVWYYSNIFDVYH